MQDWSASYQDENDNVELIKTIQNDLVVPEKQKVLFSSNVIMLGLMIICTYSLNS